MHYINETKIIIFCFIKLKNIRYNILNKYIYDNKKHIISNHFLRGDQYY